MSANKRAAPTQAASTPAKTPRHETFEPGVHVIFLGVSRYKDIGEEGHDARIPCDPAASSFEAGDVLGSLTPERLQQLEDSLGPGLVSNIGPKKKQENGLADLAGRIAKLQKSKTKLIEPQWNERLVLLHQQIVTVLWAERSQRMTIEYRTLEWIEGLIKQGANSLADHVFEYSRPVLFYIPLQRHDWTVHPHVRDLYEALDALQASRSDISVFPNYHENWNYGYKAADIMALDTIARDESTPETYRHRPKTCLGIGACTLAELQGPQFVRFGFGDRDDYIQYDANPEDNEYVHSQPNTQGFANRRVFHQQFFPPFSEWGHIRVLMIDDQIIARGFSSRNQQTKQFNTSALRHDCHFDFRAAGLRHPNTDQRVTERQEAKLEELNNFCKWWQQQLKTQYPDLFESLDVGCVMRVGLSEASLDGKFFIIDIQRWYASSFCSMDLVGKPFDQLCRAFGEQFARVHGSFAKYLPGN
ncbi:uncharacterized protein BKA55DRAFT_694639 [Fusarium redolens]|uniref:Uncharacterized protein n=1 Tax=Fusarium redolens TaxID=48865 RepID=A0A9P9GDH3_FUSRE|nr:uncharacterized protein BKA55DRAFT_694639 [Fusarium redolens]KAH7237016.1 hypothetical protein BKA55DRAFT_694639 [Fusarium redolens]